MAITVKETFREQRVERNKSEERLVRTFLVITDNVATTREQILNLPGIPQMGDDYPYSGRQDPPNIRAFVVAMEALRRGGDWRAWDVFITYTTGGTGGVNNPLMRAPAVRLVNQSYQRVVEREVFHLPDRDPADDRTDDEAQRDISGDYERLPILNTAGERFDPLPEVPDSYAGIQIVRNESAWSAAPVFSWIRAGQWNNAINVKTVRILDDDLQPLCGLMNVDAELRRESGVAFFSVSYTILYNPDTWKLFLLNQGYRTRQLTGFDTTIYNRDGSVPSEPTPLDWHGKVVGRPPSTLTLPIFPGFHVYRELDFDALQLPASLFDVITLPSGEP